MFFSLWHAASAAFQVDTKSAQTTNRAAAVRDAGLDVPVLGASNNQHGTFKTHTPMLWTQVLG